MFQVYLPNFIVNFSWEEVVISISFVYSPWVGTPEIKRKGKKKKRKKTGRREGIRRNQTGRSASKDTPNFAVKNPVVRYPHARNLAICKLFALGCSIKLDASVLK